MTHHAFFLCPQLQASLLLPLLQMVIKSKCRRLLTSTTLEQTSIGLSSFPFQVQSLWVTQSVLPLLRFCSDWHCGFLFQMLLHDAEVAIMCTCVWHWCLKNASMQHLLQCRNDRHVVCYIGLQCRKDCHVCVLCRVTVQKWPSCACVTQGYSVEMTIMFVSFTRLQCRNDRCVCVLLWIKCRNDHHVCYAGSQCRSDHHVCVTLGYSVEMTIAFVCYIGLQWRNGHHVSVLHWVTVHIDLTTMSLCYTALQCKLNYHVYELHWITVWKWLPCLCVYIRLHCGEDHNICVLHWVTVQT